MSICQYNLAFFFVVPCDEVAEITDLCAYQNENFELECFGDCGREEAFSEETVPVAHLWDECTAEDEVLDCNRYESLQFYHHITYNKLVFSTLLLEGVFLHLAPCKTIFMQNLYYIIQYYVATGK